MKKCIILLASFFFVALLSAQPASRPAPYYNAYLNNGLSALKAIIGEMEAAYNQSPTPAGALELARAQYGAVGACFAQQEEKTAKQLLDEASKHIKPLLKEEQNAEAHALYAGILGMKIAISPMKGPFLGSQASNHAALALELAPDNPFVRLQHSTNLFYTPPAFGGSLEQAIEGYQLACQGYEAQGTANNWAYLQCLAMLGQAQQADGEMAAARATYQKALAIAPDFDWVKEELLPALEQ